MADFETWLVQRHYRKSTAHKTALDIARLRRWYADGYESNGDSDMQAVRRYATWLYEIKPPTRGGFDGYVRGLKLEPLPALKAKALRTQHTQSLSDAEWKAMVSTLKQDKSPEGVVLLVMASTGHRIGDMLRLDRETLQLGMRSGILQLERKGGRYVEVPIAGAPAAWKALQQSWTGGATVAEWIAPTSDWGAEAGGGAYQRVRRHLQRLAKLHGLQGRVHLHRLRRTVGVRALGKTKDIHAVQQLLGHATIRSTEQYVNELRAEDVAALQRQLLEDD